MTSSESSSRSASSASTVNCRSPSRASCASVDEPRHQLFEHALARHRFVARMQRREFYRNAGPLRQRRVAGLRADRRDRTGIGVEIFVGVGRGARALAEHVERIAELGVAAGAMQRLVDGLPEHEMRAEEPHRLPRRRAHRGQAEPPHDAVENRLRRLAGMNDAGGDAERPGRGRDQKRGRFHVAVAPAAGGELVLDQPVGGRGVGHAQQRLGQHHERQALLGRERIGVQKFLDAAEPAGLGADGFDQFFGAGIDAGFGRGVAGGIRKQTRRQAPRRAARTALERSEARSSPGHRALHRRQASPNQYGVPAGPRA